MAILHRNRLLDLLDSGELVIESTDPRVPFDCDSQVVADTIDLRLSPKILRYRGNVQVADTLSDEFEYLFEHAVIPASGYVLQPGHVVFASVIEVVCIKDGRYSGRFSNRGTYSRFGVSVTCGKLRFPPGDPGTPDLQLANHSSMPVRIYPYVYIVQLQLETMEGTPIPYRGAYPKSIGPVPPTLSERDRSVVELLRTVSPTLPHSDQEPARVANLLAEDVDLSPARTGRFRIVMAPRIRTLSSMVVGALASAVGGFIINMLTQDSWSQWKYFSLAFATIIVIILLGIGGLLITSEKTE